MEANQKQFLLVLALYVIGNAVAITFSNLYLWQKTNDFFIILTYNAIVFLTMTVCGLISGKLAETKGVMTVYVLSMLFFILQMLLFVFFGNNILQLLLFVGIISGIAIGMQSFAFTVVMQKITTIENRAKFLGKKGALLQLITLITIPVLAILTQIVSSYIPLFIVGILIFSGVIYALRTIHFEETADVFEVGDVIRSIKINKEIKEFLLAKFLYGVQDGFFWATLGIITLEFVGNLGLWGIFSFFLSICTILAGYIYGKRASLQMEEQNSIIIAFIYGATAIILAANWNFASFVVYQLALVLLMISMGVDFDSFLSDILDREKGISHLRNEYNAFGEVFINTGRFLPMIVLILLTLSPLKTISIKLGFLLISCLPLFIMHVLSKTEFLRTIHQSKQDDLELVPK